MTAPDVTLRPIAHRSRTCLQVVPALVTGGVERGTVDMAAAQVKAGWRALVVSAGGPMVRELDRAGAEHLENRGSTGLHAEPIADSNGIVPGISKSEIADN